MSLACDLLFPQAFSLRQAVTKAHPSICRITTLFSYLFSSSSLLQPPTPSRIDAATSYTNGADTTDSASHFWLPVLKDSHYSEHRQDHPPCSGVTPASDTK